MPDTESLLEDSVDELLRGREPAPLRRAEAALLRVEQTGSRADAAAFIRESVNWLHLAITTAFHDYPSDPLLLRIRLSVEQAPLRAPFSAWRLSAPRYGLWLAYTDHVREVAAEYGLRAAQLTPPRVEHLSALATLSHIKVPEAELFRLLSEELAIVVGARTPIDEIRTTLDLSMAELARIFGVKRQALEQWSIRGAPPARRAEIDRVLEVTRYLGEKLKAERIPAIIRRPSDRLDGRSMLEVLQADGPIALLDHLRALFSYQLV